MLSATTILGSLNCSFFSNHSSWLKHLRHAIGPQLFLAIYRDLVGDCHSHTHKLMYEVKKIVGCHNFPLLHPEAICNYKIKMDYKICPTSLLMTQDSNTLKICYVFVIIVDDNLLRRTLQKMTSLKRIYNSKKPFVMKLATSNFHDWKATRCNWQLSPI